MGLPGDGRSGPARQTTPVGQDHRSLDLAIGDRPVPAQQRRGVFDHPEPVPLVEGDGPCRSLPGPDQQGPPGRFHQRRDESGADAAALAPGQHVGVTDERDVLHVLGAHDPEQRTGRRVPAEKAHPGRDFRLELLLGHVGLVPAIVGDDPAIGDRRVVDDVVDAREVVVPAPPDRPVTATRSALRHVSAPAPAPRPASVIG